MPAMLLLEKLTPSQSEFLKKEGKLIGRDGDKGIYLLNNKIFTEIKKNTYLKSFTK